MFNPQPEGGGPARPPRGRGRELRGAYYDTDTQMFREPWRTLDYGILKFWRWRVASGHLVGDGPAYGRLADRVVRPGRWPWAG